MEKLENQEKKINPKNPKTWKQTQKKRERKSEIYQSLRLHREKKKRGRKKDIPQKEMQKIQPHTSPEKNRKGWRKIAEEGWRRRCSEQWLGVWKKWKGKWGVEKFQNQGTKN